MVKRSYGQFCGIARALELVGERWAMLIVRDLLAGPKRYTDLRRGLKSIPTNVLAARLREMEENGIVCRRLLPRPSGKIVYELTEYGRELEDVLLRLGRWGAKSLSEPESGEQYIDPAIRAFRRSFRASEAQGLSITFRVAFGAFIFDILVRDATMTIENVESDSQADVELDIRGSVLPVLTGEVSPEDALDEGRVRVAGDPRHFETFVRIFNMRRADHTEEE
jgi:DNA-binding HxlR family transcriptional regulator